MQNGVTNEFKINPLNDSLRCLYLSKTLGFYSTTNNVMIQPIDLNDERIFGYRVDGEVTIDVLRPLIDQLEDKTREHTKMRVYVEYIQIDTISLKAIWEDLMFDITHLTDFEKAAVVTDKDWIGAAAQAANLIPGLEVKFFKFAEEQQAREWIRK